MKGGSHAPTISDLLPPLKICGSLLLEKDEVVVHAPGFEDRTMAFSETIEAAAGTRGILLDFRPHDPKNRLVDVRNALVQRNIEIQSDDILAYDRFEPGDFEARFRTRLENLSTRRVLVDISTMSKLEIMLVLNVCKELSLHVRLLYSEAATYGPSQSEFEQARKENKIHQPTLQIFSGVHGVVRVNSLASVAMQGQPTAAIVFMSFNDALTQVLLNTVYPSRLFLINGQPPVHKWREEATAWIHDQVRREWEEDNPVDLQTGGTALPRRVASTLDYRGTVALLLELYWHLSASHRILLAPSGSKLQAVGCYMVKALHPDIHIEYPSPEGFFHNYSSGIGTRWIVELGNLSERIEAITAVERQEYLEIPTDSSCR